jgi:hypothetical protein
MSECIFQVPVYLTVKPRRMLPPRPENGKRSTPCYTDSRWTKEIMLLDFTEWRIKLGLSHLVLKWRQTFETWLLRCIVFWHNSLIFCIPIVLIIDIESNNESELLQSWAPTHDNRDKQSVAVIVTGIVLKQYQHRSLTPIQNKYNCLNSQRVLL